MNYYKGDKKMNENYLFTSESVTEGHPDKMCDQISDAILDAFISQDPFCRVACEVVVTTGMVSIIGEISSSSKVNIPQIVRKVISDIGYSDNKYGFDANSCKIVVSIDEQSSDIAMGVDNSLENKNGSSNKEDENGAGDQGMMFGYACKETAEYMPLPISIAHNLARQLAAVRKDNTLKYLRPDGKTQVTIEYVNNIPTRVDSIIISAQHSPDINMSQLKKDIIEYVVNPIVDSKLRDEDTKIYVNPTGRFVVGGPHGDSGLTGRKIIVDTYGGYSRHGGGAFSGKDPSKVDRTAAYMARYIAKNIVAAGLADKCEIQLAYGIGIAHPISVFIDTFGTGKYPNVELVSAIEKVFDMRPSAIIEQFDLRTPIYQAFSTYGHMGREDLEAKWEQLDKVDALKSVLINEEEI